MDDDVERVIDTFLSLHEAHYPDDDPVRDKLRERRSVLNIEAQRLLAYELPLLQLFDIIGTEMAKRTERGDAAPATLNFCAGAVMVRANDEDRRPPPTKPAGKKRRRAAPDLAVDTAANMAEFSPADYRQVRGRVHGGAWELMSLAEQARWWAYMAAWAKRHGFRGPDPLGRNTDPSYAAPAEQAVREAESRGAW